MSCYSELCPFMAKFDTAQLILVSLEESVLNCLRTSFDDIEW